MAKKGTIQRNLSIERKIKAYEKRRAALKSVACNRSASPNERFEAQMKLAALPRDSSKTRYKNRCQETGRARGFYRRFCLSRILFRELASQGMIPGVTKASW